jgi:GNAT superfamily N-acetyltransferase
VTIGPYEFETLCAAAMPHERLTADELKHICYGERDLVLGEPEGAIAITTKRFDAHVAAWILLVAVHPDRQGKGAGKALMARALDAAKELGARSVHLANAVPRYVWPGVELANTRAGMLCETMGFHRDLVGVNMSIPTAFRREPPPGIVVERETTDAALSFAALEYSHWVPELAVAIERGTAFAARNEFGATVGFACHSCNRNGWIGPMATSADLQHGGVGSALLGALCEDLAARGHGDGEISWVSNFRFYGKCGATVSRVFQGGALKL